jgi:hypothetical protein
MDKSQIFTQYNKARKAVSDGILERGRVNRALGIAQSKSERKYETTVGHCTCPDSTYRPGVVCKHRIALMMEIRSKK